MSQVDETHYDIYVAFGAERCTRLHCEGWPGYWKPAIEYNKRSQSWWIESKVLVAQIPASAGPIVEMEARAIPAQSAGLWAAYLLFRLQKKGLIPEGIYEHWRAQLEIPATDEDAGPSSCL